MAQDLAKAYIAALEDPAAPNVMGVCRTNANAEEVNDEVARLLSSKKVLGRAREIGGRDFAVGMPVTLKKDIGILKKNESAIISEFPATGGVRIETLDGRSRVLTAAQVTSFVEQGFVTTAARAPHLETRPDFFATMASGVTPENLQELEATGAGLELYFTNPDVSYERAFEQRYRETLFEQLCDDGPSSLAAVHEVAKRAEEEELRDIGLASLQEARKALARDSERNQGMSDEALAILKVRADLEAHQKEFAELQKLEHEAKQNSEMPSLARQDRIEELARDIARDRRFEKYLTDPQMLVDPVEQARAEEYREQLIVEAGRDERRRQAEIEREISEIDETLDRYVGWRLLEAERHQALYPELPRAPSSGTVCPSGWTPPAQSSTTGCAGTSSRVARSHGHSGRPPSGAASLRSGKSCPNAWPTRILGSRKLSRSSARPRSSNNRSRASLRTRTKSTKSLPRCPLSRVRRRPRSPSAASAANGPCGPRPPRCRLLVSR